MIESQGCVYVSRYDVSSYGGDPYGSAGEYFKPSVSSRYQSC